MAKTLPGGGSLPPEVCAEKILMFRADLGVALDGHADRAILREHRGEVVDGAQIMFLRAWRLKKKILMTP